MTRFVDIKKKPVKLICHALYNSFWQSFMNYTAVCQQQETGNWAHKNSFRFDIDSFSWGNLSLDWPWPFSPI